MCAGVSAAFRTFTSPASPTHTSPRARLNSASVPFATNDCTAAPVGDESARLIVEGWIALTCVPSASTVLAPCCATSNFGSLAATAVSGSCRRTL